MNISRALVFLYFCAAASGLGCGVGRASDSADDPEDGAPPESQAASPEAGPTTVDAGEAGAPSTNCSVTISGAWSSSWTSDLTSPSFCAQADLSPYYGETGSLSNYNGINQLYLAAPYSLNGFSYLLALTAVGVTGPGTYTAGVDLSRTCIQSSCPGLPGMDFGDEWGAESACTITLDVFSPADRGGMNAHFSCDPVPRSDPSMGEDPPEIAIAGSFYFAPLAATPSSPPDDAGTWSDDPTSCTLHITGGDGAYDLTEVGDGWAYGAGDVWCDGVGTDLQYSLMFGPDSDFGRGSADAAAPTVMLSLTGEAFCAGACYVDYLSTRGCALDVLLDGADGGRYKANFDCEGLEVIGVPDDAGTGALRVVGSIDGIVGAPPPPE